MRTRSSVNRRSSSSRARCMASSSACRRAFSAALFRASLLAVCRFVSFSDREFARISASIRRIGRRSGRSFVNASIAGREPDRLYFEVLTGNQKRFASSWKGRDFSLQPFCSSGRITRGREINLFTFMRRNVQYRLAVVAGTFKTLGKSHCFEYLWPRFPRSRRTSISTVSTVPEFRFGPPRLINGNLYFCLRY